MPAALLLCPLSAEEFGTLCEHPGAVGAAAGWLEFALSHSEDTQDQKFHIAPGFAGVFTWAGGHAPRWDPRVEDSLPQTLAVNGGQGKHVAGQRALGVRTRDLLGLPKKYCSSQE